MGLFMNGQRLMASKDENCSIHESNSNKDQGDCTLVCYQGADLTNTDDLGQNLLHHAVKSYSDLTSLSIHSDDLNEENQKYPIHLIKIMTSSPQGKHACLQVTNDGYLSPLHLCCRSIVPDGITKIIASANPEAIAIQDEEGDTPLHSAFRYGASNEVIREIVELAYSHFHDDDGPFSKINDDGDNPLHAAISHEASCQSVQLLLDAFPQGISCMNGREQSPLHIAAEHDRYDIIEVMVNSHASIDSMESLLSLKDDNGLSPLFILWNKISNGLEGENVDIVESQEILKCFTLLLQSTGYYIDDLSDNEDSPIYNLLLTSINLGNQIVPEGYVSFLIKNHSEVLYKSDVHGRLPLHIAALNYSNNITDYEHLDDNIGYDYERDLIDPMINDTFFPKKNDLCNHPDSRSHYNIGASTLSNFKSPIFNIILDQYPAAAFILDKSGRLPIHLGIEAGMSWDEIKPLLEVNPLSIECRDPLTGLLPFMLAAQCKCSESGEIVNTVFKVLQHCPHLIMNVVHKNDSSLVESPPQKRQKR